MAWEMTDHNTHHTPHPKCPHCGYELDTNEMLMAEVTDRDLYEVAVNEEAAPLKCPACDHDYWVRGGYTPHYTAAWTEFDL
jgi:uncharacterized protein with PIN domain